MKTDRTQKKYNIEEFNGILRIMAKNKIQQGILEYQRYLEKYPDDIRAYAYYINALIRLGDFSFVEEEIERIMIRNRANDLDIKCLIIEKAKSLCYQKKYLEALNLIEQNRHLHLEEDENIIYLMAYIKRRLQLPYKKDPQGRYIYRQVTQYDENLLFKSLERYRNSRENSNNIQFNASFPLEEIYTEIKSKLPHENRYYLNGYENLYFFEYKNSGIVKGKRADYIKVLTVDDSNNILTMVPTNNIGTLSTIDLDYQIEPSQSPKVRILSQTEKFNKRYKI